MYPPGTDLTFKRPNEQSYQRFRVLVQFLDSMELSALSHFYCKRELLASAMYIVIGGPHMMGVFPYEYQWLTQLFSTFCPLTCNVHNPMVSHHFNADQLILFNQLFESFLT
jgi:hypothetical protein